MNLPDRVMALVQHGDFDEYQVAAVLDMDVADVAHVLSDPSYEPPSPGGSISPAPLDEYAQWVRTGAADNASGSFDYTADLTSADPHGIITVDDSAAWVASWGAAVPMVSETGLYCIIGKASVSPSGLSGTDWLELSAYLYLMDDQGANLFDWLNDFREIRFYGPQSTGDTPASTVRLTLALPAGTHFDHGYNGYGSIGGSAPNPANQVRELLIQRVA
jgi:hypothetical protein